MRPNEKRTADFGENVTDTKQDSFEAWLDEEINESGDRRGDNIRRNGWALDYARRAFEAGQAAQAADAGRHEGRRKLTCDAINGAMAYGYNNSNPPPRDNHWLAPYWKFGRDYADLVEALEACEASMLAKGVPTDPEHPDRIALDKARAALSRAKEQK